jgi:hypothetical protein
VTYFADWKAQPGGIAGVPVRNYIDQSHEFALCLFVMAPLIVSLATNGQRAWTFAFAVVMLGFYLDMRFVATSRTAFAYFPILSILFAVKYLNRRRATYFLLLAAVVEFAVLLSSPYSRDRIGRTVHDYKVDRDTSVDRGTDPPRRNLERPAAGVLAAFHQVDFRGAVFWPRHRIDPAAFQPRGRRQERRMGQHRPQPA